MPGLDRVESLANVVGIEGEFTTINEQLVKTRELIAQINGQKITAKNLSFKEIQAAQDAYNKSLLQTEKQTQSLIQTQIKEEQLAQQRIKTAQLEEKQLKAVNDQKEKSSSLSSRPIESIPFEIKSGGEPFNPDVVNAPTQEQTDALNEQTEAQIEYAKAARDSAEATEESGKAAGEAAGEYVLELTPLEESIKARDQLQNKIQDLQKNQKEDAELLKAGTIDRVEYNKRVIESKAAIEDSKNKLKDLNAEVKAQAAIANSATGSLKNNKAQLELLTIQYGKLSKEQQASPVGLKMQQDAKAFATAIDAQQSSIGNYTKNVGNYFSKAYSGLRILANILPGVGIAGIIGAIGTALLFVVEKLNIFETTAHKTTRQIQELTGVSQECKDALKGMGEDGAEIAKKVFDELVKSTEKLNEELGLSPTVIEKAAAARQLLFKQAADPSLWDHIVSLIKNAGSETASIIDRFEQAGKEAKKLNDQLADLEFAQSEVNKLEFGKEANKVSIQAIKDQISANKELISDTRNSFAERRSLTDENFVHETDILQTQRNFDEAEIKRTVKDEEQKYNKLYALDNKFLSDSLNARRERDKAIQALNREEIERNRKAQFDIQSGIDNDEIKRNQKVADDADVVAERRIAALQKVAEASSGLFDKQEADELSKVFLTDTQKEAIHAKYDALRVDNAKATAEKIFNIYLNSDLLARSAADKLRENLNEADRIAKIGNGEGALSLRPENADLNINLDKFERQTDALGELKRAGDLAGIAITKVFKIGDFQSVDDYLKQIQKIKEAFQQLGQEVSGAIFDIFTNKIINQKNAIQDQIDALDEKKAKDIEVATASIANEQDRAAAIQTINSTADAQATLLKKKQRDLDIRKAQFDKAQAIAGIILNTAQAVTAALTSKPPNVILAGIVGAIGLIQLARAAAAPIPRYKKGTGNKPHPGGLAEVGDGGKQEGIILPDGTILASGRTANIMDLPPGTIVHQDLQQMLSEMSMQKVPYVNAQGKLIDPRPEIRHMEGSIVRAIMKQNRPRPYMEPRYKTLMEKGHPFRVQIDNKL